MAARVVWYREAWWIRTRWGGNKKKDKRIGATKAHKRQAEEIAKKINGALALGTFQAQSGQEKSLPCDEELRCWHRTYGPTMKPSSEVSTRGLIENHLVPYFQARDLREIREADLLAFAKAKVDAGLSPKTVQNALSVLRRVYLTGVNYFFRSTTTIPAAVGVSPLSSSLLPEVTGGDRYFFARHREAAGFLPFAAWP